ncbi:MAG: Ig-like domain-containing protein [Gemmatimonadetes bacterium]|nr:Ig-like domain-containing protein [Gemmatimonadota bacterium]
MRAVIAVVLLVMSAACLDTPVDTTGVPTHGVAPSANAIIGVTMRYVSVDLAVGETMQLSYTPKLSNTGAFIPQSYNWHSTTPAVATVDPNGIVTAVAPGSSFVIVTIDGYSGQTTVNVKAAPAASR